RLAEIGEQAVVPMMQFVMRLLPRQKQAHTWPVMIDGLHKVQEMGHASKPLEILLRDFLATTLKKKSDELTALHTANTLHVLFPKKYPSPQPAGNKMVANANEFLQVPIG